MRWEFREWGGHWSQNVRNKQCQSKAFLLAFVMETNFVLCDVVVT